MKNLLNEYFIAWGLSTEPFCWDMYRGLGDAHSRNTLFINIVGYLDHMHGPSYQMKWWWVALICTMTASISLIMSGVATWDRNIGHEFGSSFSSPTNLESFSHISCFWILFHEATRQQRDMNSFNKSSWRM